MNRGEGLGVAAGIASSAIGGLAAAVTRFAVAGMDPILVTLFRFGVGFLVLLPVAWATRARWPRGADLAATAALGVLFYGVFFVVYARALTLTTAARGSLGVATLPLLTMLVAAALRREALTARKAAGVLIALAGVGVSLASGLQTAPADAWRGDLMMMAAMLSMSLYSIYSRPLMARSGALGYACAGMAAGAAWNVVAAQTLSGGPELRELDAAHWAAGFFLGVFPGAIGFYLWVYALQRTTPTRVASTITVSPVFAAVLGSILVDEPIGANLLIGIAAIAAGIWIASTASDRPARRS